MKEGTARYGNMYWKVILSNSDEIFIHANILDFKDHALFFSSKQDGLLAMFADGAWAEVYRTDEETGEPLAASWV